MSYAATSAYRDMEVLSASPGRLVVIVFDFLIVNLRRSRIAIDTGNAALLSASIAKSQDALVELLGGLDLENGGKVATGLAALYGFFLRTLIDVATSKDGRVLDRIITQVTDLRDAFAQISAVQSAHAA